MQDKVDTIRCAEQALARFLDGHFWALSEDGEIVDLFLPPPKTRIRRARPPKNPPPLPGLELAAILHGVAEASGIMVSVLRGCSRRNAVVRARQFYCHKARHTTDKSLNQIGIAINRDHTTVVHSIHTVDAHPKRFASLAVKYKAKRHGTDSKPGPAPDLGRAGKADGAVKASPASSADQSRINPLGAG